MVALGPSVCVIPFCKRLLKDTNAQYTYDATTIGRNGDGFTRERIGWAITLALSMGVSEFSDLVM